VPKDLRRCFRTYNTDIEPGTVPKTLCHRHRSLIGKKIEGVFNTGIGSVLKSSQEFNHRWTQMNSDKELQEIGHSYLCLSVFIRGSIFLPWSASPDSIDPGLLAAGRQPPILSSLPPRPCVSAVNLSLFRTPHSALRIQKGGDFLLFVVILYLASPEVLMPAQYGT
jgi:hypothetical protein